MPRVELLAATGFAVNLAALTVREVRYGGAFPHPLELVYLTSLLIAVAAVLTARVMRVRLRRRRDVVLEDERSHAVQRQAAFVTLSALLLVQIPFIIGVTTSSAKALALLTVTTGVAVFYAARTWLERGA